jgi:hypothetical protein
MLYLARSGFEYTDVLARFGGICQADGQFFDGYRDIP